MAAALPYIAAATGVYGAVKAGKKPKGPKEIEVADELDPESLVKKRNTQREAQKKYGASGRAGTLLSGSSTLG